MTEKRLLTPYIMIGASFVVTLIAVCMTTARATRWAWGVPTLVAVVLFFYLLLAPPGSSTDGLAVMFGFFFSALGSIPAALLGALIRRVRTR